ncbi:MAG TPA: hypothetical protein VGG95_03535 [Edaphobacter sp.]|jgi:hypothetical protein
MRSASIAEWIVSRFTSAQEAAAVIGDLEEQRPQKGVLWFWASLTGFLFLLCWRRLLALLAAFYLSSKFFPVAILSTKSHHHPRESWVLPLLALTAVVYFLWMACIYAAIRYGLRDKMTQQSLLWCGIVTATFVSWDHPAVVYLTFALGGLQIILSMAKPAGRRQFLMAAEFLVVATTVGTGLVSYLSILILLRFGFSTLYSATGPSVIVLGHSPISWIKFPLSFMAAWATTSVYSRMHSWVSQWNEPTTTNESDFV